MNRQMATERMQGHKKQHKKEELIFRGDVQGGGSGRFLRRALGYTSRRFACGVCSAPSRDI